MNCLYNVLKNTSVTYESKPCYLGGEENHIDKNISNETVHEFERREQELENKFKNADIEIEAKRKTMINELQREVNRIVEQTKSECKELLIQKTEEGFKEGMKVAEKRCENLDSELEVLKKEIVKQYDDSRKIIDNNILELAFILARKIIDIQIERDDTAILSALENIMTRFKDDNNLTVDVSEDVAQKLNSEEQKAKYKINANKELSNEEILLNSSYGTVDASIDVQFDNLKKSVLEECKKI